ncbi:uroporphyrinogen-III synthase [Shewanella salipaludis]|uniref:Uroporphyrinogen-III synthase n=1 Tax=Shewanella salipaludis TaxID=2723052 RepID=A0A972FXP3_9GAMM|nr:uroporphyrinogen-III synthase [Shewanella salipaludis]NMH65158.1 uroporphyrinogen-III synthase [Shewanella salipaludis]
MRVLLTRPDGRNAAMAAALSARGIAHLVTPLLAVEPLSGAALEAGLNRLQTADILIFISTNAVHYALSSRSRPLPSQACYAVGDATWQALSQLGIAAVKAPDEQQQTEGLLTLPALREVKGKRIVIVRGQGGRETLAEQLQARGAEVSYLEVYRRVCPPLEPQQILAQWQAFGIDTILVTSGEILENLLELVPKELFSWLRACHIIVPSPRISAQASAAGLTRVSQAKGANTQAMLDALKL